MSRILGFVNIEGKSQIKGGRIWITYLLIFVLCFSFIAIYNVGKTHGMMQGIFISMKFQEVCEYGNHTYWINETCHLGNGTVNHYKFNKNLLVHGNEGKFAEKMDILVITGIWMQELGE